MAVILVVGVFGTNFVSDAGALKSKNGASGSTDICGLTLCSDYPGGKAAYQDSWSTAFRSSTSVPMNDHSEEHSTSKSVLMSTSGERVGGKPRYTRNIVQANPF